MRWPSGRELDQAFGPRFPGLFDFTLRFEHLILTIVPIIVFLLMALWYIWLLYGQPVLTRAGGLSRVKSGMLVVVLAAEVASLGLWCTPSFRSGTAVGAAVMSCLSIVALASVIIIEHRRIPNSSTALPSAFLMLTVLIGIAKTRSYFLRAMHALAALSTVSTIFRFLLIALLEVPKRSYLIDKDMQQSIGREAVAGFWNRVFFVWLNPTFIRGFRHLLHVEDLSPLGPEFGSQELFKRLSLHWKKCKNSKNPLLKACFATFSIEFFSVVPPRLCYSGFVLAQPLYLQRVVRFIGETNPSGFVKTGLILSSILIFLGIAASRSLYQHMNYRLVAMLRGALISLILEKSLAVPYSVAKGSAALTLTSTDIEGIANGVPQFHDMWSGAIEVGVGLYLLSTVISQATFLILLPILTFTVLTYFGGNALAKSLGVWNGKIQERVASTTKVFLQIKSIKLIGLENAASQYIKKSRLVEIASYKLIRKLSAAMVVMNVATEALPPILAIAGGLFWTTFNGRLDAVNVFTTLAIVNIITNPMVLILQTYPRITSIGACFDRIQKYLSKDDVEACRGNYVVDEAAAEDEAKDSEKSSSQLADGGSPGHRVIACNEASITPEADADPILRNVSFTINRSQTTILLGPVGSGKSTLLRAILGEVAISQGQLWRRPGNFAYCGQKPWLRNISIRSNIIASRPYEKAWYDKVIKACCLDSDLQQLGSKGDQSLVGTSGINLSGGQKQRVALARAIYSREPIVLLDDVLSGLDKSLSQAIFSRVFGPEGVFRESASTVIFATHSVDFLKAADQALIFDGTGSVKVQQDPSQLTLSNEFVEQLRASPDEEENESKSDKEEAPKTKDEPGEDLQSRARGDASLYKYLFTTASKWGAAIWVILVGLVVAATQLSVVFIRIWIETDPTNTKYFAVYATLGCLTFTLSGASMGLYFLKLVPENGIKLHAKLIDSAIGAKLSFLASTDTGSIINRFSQDMTILTNKMPLAFYLVVLYGFHVLFMIGIVASGAQYSALLVPFIIAVFFTLQMFYLRTSRQLRLLDIEAAAPLYTLFTETSTHGLEHIRAFGWQIDFTKETYHALDYSQRPYYYMNAIQRWLQLSMDLVGLFIALIIISTTLSFRQTTSQAGLGLSLLYLVDLSHMLKGFVSAWTDLETSLGALARLRTFLNSTPQESERQDGVTEGTTEKQAVIGSPNDEALPPQWPQSGSVQFTSVNAKYQESGPLVLEDVSLAIESGQRVVITGRSGSGKSSLLLALLGLLPYDGVITVDGIDVSTVSKNRLRSIITTISQDAVELDGSVRENLVPYIGQLDGGKIDDAMILRTLARVGLSEAISSKGGLDTSLSDVSLSVGQMQFLSLARTMLHNHWTGGKLVLMDEPTSNMDYETDAKIQGLVKEVFEGCTVIMISHRPEVLTNVEVHLQVAAGKVTLRSQEPLLNEDET